MDTGVRSNATIASHGRSHVVWCSKYRRKVLVNGIDEHLQTLIQECVERWQQEFVQVEIMPDRIHLQVGCDPSVGIHRFIKCIKGATVHQLRQEFPIIYKYLNSFHITFGHAYAQKLA